ncbi:Rne/Rng family ribonuclease [Candidatus Synechococcus calcipolaris G9]|uniref:Rne/Rng family ribonuclease n=1 Tax=Candidatus Synechococcus calcipolaris G9 TaxID=1497997 RepID=A0ABT6EZF7_9SYNE|nr:Rne/Rng family ribonuclease [Candidatus Synechococcus calcipolaris]MDG2990962.1 Rne/Rng family ribonuclease [Candidatus Synechococcus calcipolaris G9]
MSKQIIIAEQFRLAAVFAEDQIQELIVATGSHQVGDVYLGIVENVLPGIDAAFVNLGDTARNGFIHVSDLGPLRLKRTAGAITELLTPQQKVLVQVMKEPTGNKGPRLTGNVSLPGRYLVLMPYGRGVNLSRRIGSDSERHRLRALGILVKPAGMGLLVRTEAEGVSEEAILEDLELLQRQWETVQQQAASNRPPTLLGRDDDFIQRVLRDVYSSDVNRIVVDTAGGVKRVKQHLMNWNSNKPPVGVLIDHHQENIPILDYFRVNAAIREALKPRVDLPSGGYVIIEPTEALTVVDVNSGSFTSSATARETVLWTNCEAATEIARQLRLRNVAGVIIVDFIDMDSRRDQLQLLEHFSKELRADKARPQIAQLSELGLVELTRKRQGQNIYELFGRPCGACGGHGHLVHLPGESEESPGESLERTVISRTIETRRSPESRSDSYDSSASDIQLINHPGYQEVGGTRQRSSRSRGGNGSPARPTRSRGEAPSNGRKNASPAPELTDAVNSPANSVTKVIPTEKATPVETHRDNSSSGGGRPSRPTRAPRPRSEPSEVIAVTMTQEEQQIYAAMGISPIVLYPDEVKNVRSAVVMVALPGQTPVPPPEKEAPAIANEDSSENSESSENGEGSESPGDSKGGESMNDTTPVTSSKTTKVIKVEPIVVKTAAIAPDGIGSASSKNESDEPTEKPEPTPLPVPAEAPSPEVKNAEVAVPSGRRRRRRGASEQLSLETDT